MNPNFINNDDSNCPPPVLNIQNINKVEEEEDSLPTLDEVKEIDNSNNKPVSVNNTMNNMQFKKSHTLPLYCQPPNYNQLNDQLNQSSNISQPQNPIYNQPLPKYNKPSIDNQNEAPLFQSYRQHLSENPKYNQPLPKYNQPAINNPFNIQRAQTYRQPQSENPIYNQQLPKYNQPSIYNQIYQMNNQSNNKNIQNTENLPIYKQQKASYIYNNDDYNNLNPFSILGQKSDKLEPKYVEYAVGKDISLIEYNNIKASAITAYQDNMEPLSSSISHSIRSKIGGEWFVFISPLDVNEYDFSLSVVNGNNFMSFSLDNKLFQICRIKS